jgi:hypothetical protein
MVGMAILRPDTVGAEVMTSVCTPLPLLMQVVAAADRAARAEMERDSNASLLEKALIEHSALTRAASEMRVKAAEAVARVEAHSAQVRTRV